MKTKTLFGSSLAALVLLAAATHAFGQEAAPVAITVFSGGSFLKGERTFNVGGTPMRTNYAKGGRLGFRGTMRLASHWALEGTYSYGRDNLRISDLSGVVPSTRGFGVKAHQLTGNALYYVNPAADKFKFYGTAGIGLARFSPTDAAKASAALEFVDEPATISPNNKLDFNFGGGVEAKMSSRYGVRFDFRDHVSSIPRFGVPQNPTPGILDFYPVSGAVHNLETSVGLIFYLKR
jgi:opacity protein-like surface antigen